MRNDYENATMSVIGSAHEVILGRKEPGPPYESDVDLWFVFIEDDDE